MSEFMPELLRHAGIASPTIAVPGLVVAPLPALWRLSLRGDDVAAIGACKVLGIAVPSGICRGSQVGTRAALQLGPDEWLLLGSAEADAELPARIRQQIETWPHALLDVSHGSAGLRIEGSRASDLLAVGCALDLSPDAFPIGACTRTLFAKAEILLWRTGPDAFHVETGRSFAGYLIDLIGSIVALEFSRPG
jgi:sarcosine oxidase subunit gamma